MSFPKIYPVIVKTKTYLKSYNFYIIKEKDTVFLIDASIDTDESWHALNHQLKKQKLCVKDIDFIALTHHHIDHIGLINRIRSEVDVPVYAHPKAFPHLRRDEQFLKMRIDFFKRLYAEMGSKTEGDKRVNKMKEALVKNKDQAIDGSLSALISEDTVGSFQVIDAPGHASDHIAFYEPKLGHLISGDNLFLHMNSNALIEPDKNGQMIQSLQQYEQTLKTFSDLHITTVFPGHGHLIKNPTPLINKRLKHLFKNSERIKNLIIQQRLTATQIAHHMYGDLYEKLFSFVMSEVVGHLYRLEILGQVSYEIKNGVRYYYAEQ